MPDHISQNAMWKMVARPAGGVPRLRRSRVFAYVTRPLRAGLTYAAPPAPGLGGGGKIEERSLVGAKGAPLLG